MQALLHRIVSRIRDEGSSATSDDRAVDAEAPSYSMFGGTAGFIFYWLAFAIPFVMYGSNTLFFFLYTWPFFLALVPISVLIGIAFSMLFGGNWWRTLAATGVVVIGMFWTIFSFLSGW
ncbi:MAG: DUF3561 family protein [Ewingella sp.]|uniref:DUF3561 family protein n=1 Tax=Ewingella allii TaxID=3092550 RepID=UPI002656C634|nr:DUF3561 family protein [Ewingella sp.]